MARKLRTKGTSGVYHVLMEGTRDTELFRDEEDYRQFVEMLEHQMVEADGEDGCSDGPDFTLYAYCLMPKCFHLLLKEEKMTVSKALSKLSCAYSSYLNNKYGKSGTSYRDRFHSEPIDEPERLDIVMRHIHQAPLSMEGVSSMDDYPYSSWHEHVGIESELPSICTMPETYMELSKEERREWLLKALPEGTECLEPKAFRLPKPSNEQVLGMVRLLTPARNWDEFRALLYEERLKTIRELMKNGASFRQLEKLTGVGRGVIQNLK